ncbi:MAG: ABC transporter permease subunit [Cyanobacteria bacterium P01_H01_bin.121]
MLNPFQETLVPLGDWIQTLVQWVVTNFRWVFQLIRWPVDQLLTGVENFFVAIPQVIFIVVVSLLAWQVGGRGLAILSFISLVAIGLIGAWQASMITLALVITAVAVCVLIGLPLGILAASNDRFEGIIRPFLDVMQTLPSFVYLVPVVMLFGTGKVPGVIVTFIFAVPPLIRLTNIGLRQVQADVVEASTAFGATPQQTLWEVKIPLAMPTILAGVNQALMLALSMVVIASLIAVEGLGQMVNRGIGRLDVGLAAVGGIGIVLIAIMLDRITQAIGHPPKDGLTVWQRGPIGFFLKGRRSRRTPSPAT